MRCVKSALKEWRKWSARITEYWLNHLFLSGGSLLREQAYSLEQIDVEGLDWVRLPSLQLCKYPTNRSSLYNAHRKR